jgi:phospholipase/carboxylesterase
MAFRVAMSYPDQFAGVLSLCGAFPNSGTPLAKLAEARRLPVFLAVGRRSQPYPPADACENLRLLHSAGLPVITLRQYPGGQQLARPMLVDMNAWIMEQIKASQAEPSHSNAQQPGQAD